MGVKFVLIESGGSMFKKIVKSIITFPVTITLLIASLILFKYDYNAIAFIVHGGQTLSWVIMFFAWPEEMSI